MIFQPGASGGGGNAKIETIEWIGNGTYGQDHPIILNFSFPPEIVLATSSGMDKIVFNSATKNSSVWIYYPQGLGIGAYSGYIIGRIDGQESYWTQKAFRSEDGKTMTWWIELEGGNDDSLSEIIRTTMQFNLKNSKYTYIAIG